MYVYMNIKKYIWFVCVYIIIYNILDWINLNFNFDVIGNML